MGVPPTGVPAAPWRPFAAASPTPPSQTFPDLPTPFSLPYTALHMGIGTVLLDRGLVSKPQLEQAIAEQRSSGERLDRVMVRMGLVSRDQVLSAIGDQFHTPIVALDGIIVEPKVLQSLPAKLVYKQNCVPISRDETTLTVATSDPFELAALDELRLLTG